MNAPLKIEKPVKGKAGYQVKYKDELLALCPDYCSAEFTARAVFYYTQELKKDLKRD